METLVIGDCILDKSKQDVPSPALEQAQPTSG
jgi:hypothetical protein